MAQFYSGMSSSLCFSLTADSCLLKAINVDLPFKVPFLPFLALPVPLDLQYQ
jgi:hypothetical protein